MKLEDKHQNKISRSIYRRKMRLLKYIDNIRKADHNVWVDPNSETGYSQKCCYEGRSCQYPCNGDC